MGYIYAMSPHDEHSRRREPFDLSGGALCLDFANTWGNRADPSTDRLRGYEQLVAFVRQTGVLSAAAAGALSRTAAEDAEHAASALAEVRHFRQSIYCLFSTRARSGDVPPGEVDKINGVLGAALSRRRLAQGDGGLVWTWEDVDPGDLRAPLWPVIESAASLLTSDDLDRVRECGAEDCNWLFLDCSRAGTRRWCSMSSCGNREKARRYYRRQQECCDTEGK